MNNISKRDKIDDENKNKKNQKHKLTFLCTLSQKIHFQS